MEHFDVLIVGAGLSGIGGACRLEKMCPTKSYAVLEGRAALGGTWDLFRFPGIRSDSDMFTLGYPFRPWNGATAIAEGASILRYLQQTATEFGVDDHIRYRHRVISASWSSAEGLWTIEAAIGDEHQAVCYTANFLYLCSGYYSYEGGHRPQFQDADSFEGPVLHPQQWPAEVDYRGKRVVIIGSGATAITMAPAMADQAAHVTLLQRSPSYVISLPAVDPLWERVAAVLPNALAYRLTRWKNVGVATVFYQLCRRWPSLAKRILRSAVTSQLPKSYPVDPDFTPRYDPWDQRLCVVPDGDLFTAIRSGQVSIVTGQIERFTPHGIRLRSGNEIEADLIVTATGLTLVACGSIRLQVDGDDIDPSESFLYRGFMLSDLPNLAMCFGYTNASWTLRSDLVSQAVCHLLNEMDDKGYSQAVAHLGAGPGEVRPLLDLTSGYVTRATDRFPKQGTRGPWKFRQNYILDFLNAKVRHSHRDLSFSTSPTRTLSARKG